jgi:hypothetical protein
MAEEYILKLKDSEDKAEMISKEQWDGSKDDKTFRFIPLGQGIREEIIKENNDIVDIKKYPVTFGLILDINNEKDLGYFFYLYEYEENKYTWEWVRMIRGALRYEARAQLKDKKVWDAITTAVNTIIDPEALAEFKRIIQSIALGNALYTYLENNGIKVEEINTKEYYYKIYKYALKGKLDFNTYVSITNIEYSDEWIVLDPDYIESLEFRIESAYD